MVTEEELQLVDRCASDTLAVVRELLALRKDAERWRAMREQLVAVDWAYGDPPISIAAFMLKTGIVMAGSKGADAIADAAVAEKLISKQGFWRCTAST